VFESLGSIWHIHLSIVSSGPSSSFRHRLPSLRARYQVLRTQTRTPDSDTGHQTPHQNSATAQPHTRHRTLELRHHKPELTHRTPDLRRRTPDTAHQNSDTTNQNSHTARQISHTAHQNSDTAHQISDTVHQNSDTRSQTPLSRSQPIFWLLSRSSRVISACFLAVLLQYQTQTPHTHQNSDTAKC
jgi:hypothetical protein